jgi:hypothetical protein
MTYFARLSRMPVLAIVLAVAGLSAATAAGDLPSYGVQFLGSGSPTAINGTGVVVGIRVVNGNYVPLVSTGGAPWATLPTPAGALSTLATDINDGGVIVGVSYDAQMVPKAVRWRAGAGGYTVEFLPRFTGDSSSYATAINNLGQIVGARGALGYVPTGGGWLYSDSTGLTDLQARYGWYVVPADLNDAGFVIGGAERLDLDTGLVQWIGDGPSNYNPVTGVAINSAGRIAGAASLRSTSLNIVSAFRYDVGTGWTFIAGSSRYTLASSVNDLGDVVYGELGAGVYLEGLGTYAVNDLLSPTTTAAGWAVTGNGGEINGQRAIATLGRNSLTAQTGGVLLTPSGVLEPPTAPTNLSGVAHTATRSEPYNSIDLTWQNTSAQTRSYELQRSAAGANQWSTLSLTPPATATNHTDTTVGVGIIYDYRVRAVGVAGAGPWSNVATVKSPTVPLDTTKPVVTIRTPASGATVSGTVAVAADATDNVGVEYLEISFWNQYTGQQVVLGSVSKSGSLSVNWNTAGLTPATYTLRAYAYDAIGNWAQTEIPVTVGAGNSMRVASIALSAKAAGSKVNVTADVAVSDAAGRAVGGATVSARWTLPGGGTQVATAVTGSTGRARFTASGPRGTYVFTVTGVTKPGYAFDSGGSVLTRSITR